MTEPTSTRSLAAYCTAAASGSVSVTVGPTSAMRNNWLSSSSLYGPQFAGWVTAIPTGGAPSCSQTVSYTQRSSLALSCSAEYGEPPTRIGVVSPMRRLNSRTTRGASLAARRAAAVPTSRFLSGPSHRTDGTDVPWCSRVTICGSPVSRPTAAAVNVVPRATASTYDTTPPSRSTISQGISSSFAAPRHGWSNTAGDDSTRPRSRTRSAGFLGG